MVGFRAPNYYNNPPIRKVRPWGGHGGQGEQPESAGGSQGRMRRVAGGVGRRPRRRLSGHKSTRPCTCLPLPHCHCIQALAKNGYLYDSTIIERW